MAALNSMDVLEMWRVAVTETVRRDTPDLSARQLALVLTVYLRPPPHTVRGLAAHLNVSKPAITRALDRLEKLGLVRRRKDPADRRSVLIQRTVAGSLFLSEFADTVTKAAAEVRTV